MLLRPSLADARAILHTVGVALLVLGGATAALAVVTLVLGDVNSATALATGGAFGICLGVLGVAADRTHLPLTWTRAAVAATMTWTVGSLVAAIPLYLSGHYRGYLESVFEALSGLTTTSLTLVEDLDHLPAAIGMYRHALELLGGLAVVIAGLTILTAATVTASSMALADVHDERIMPNITRVVRQVLTVAATVIAVGAVLSTIAVALAGVTGWRALLHGIGLAISAATTGGFTAQSASLGYFHSPLLQATLAPLMVAGALSFALHQVAWQGRGRRLVREFEVRTFLVSFTLLAGAVLVGLARSGAHTEFTPLLRHGLFSTLAAHTTTGLQVAPGRVIALDWGGLAPAALVAAMTVGGMTGSTAGGMKLFRLGILAKGLVTDVRRFLLPEGSLSVRPFQWGRSHTLKDAHVRSAATLFLVLLAAMLAAAVMVLFVDGDVRITESLFDAVSAATNSGQTVNTLTPSSAGVVKTTFAALMLLGRLEWLAVFTTLGLAFAYLKGRA